MVLTTVSIFPNTHHVFGSRTGFSDSLLPSVVSLGGGWIVFYVFGKLFRALAAKGMARQFASWGCLGN